MPPGMGVRRKGWRGLMKEGSHMRIFSKSVLALVLAATPALAGETVPTVIVDPVISGQPAVVVETPVTPGVVYAVPEVVTTPMHVTPAPVVVVEQPVVSEVVVEQPVVPQVAVKQPVVVAAPAWPAVPGALKVTAADLIDAYAQNELAADRLYAKKMVETWGVVEQVHREASGQTVVVLTPPGRGGIVTCRLQPAGTPEAATLTKGQAIFVVGLGQGLIRTGGGGYNVLLEEAVLLR